MVACVFRKDLSNDTKTISVRPNLSNLVTARQPKLNRACLVVALVQKKLYTRDLWCEFYELAAAWAIMQSQQIAAAWKF